MKKLEIRSILIVLLFILLVLFPIRTRSQSKVSDNIRLVVLPFVCEEGYELGTAFSDKLEIALFYNDTVDVVSRSRLETANSEQKLYNRLTGLSVADIAAQIGIDYVISGCIVSHYVNKFDTRDLISYTVTAKMVSTETGMIIKVAEISNQVHKKELLEQGSEQIYQFLLGSKDDTMSYQQDAGIVDTYESNIPQPKSEKRPEIKFIPFDEAPVPIGGYASIQRNVVYPEIAQEAGIEGQVIIQAFIDKKGRVQDMTILRGLPNTGLDDAAMDVIKKTRFIPAIHKGEPVGVYVSIPVNFKLKN